MVALTDTQKVRLLIGGSGTTTYISDSEIGEFLTDTSNDVMLTALYSVDAIIASIGLKVTKKIADQSVNYSDLQEHFLNLKNQLQKRYETGGYIIAAPTSGDSEAISRFTSNQFNFN